MKHLTCEASIFILPKILYTMERRKTKTWLYRNTMN